MHNHNDSHDGKGKDKQDQQKHVRSRDERDNEQGTPYEEDAGQPMSMNDIGILQKALKAIYLLAIIGGLTVGALVVWFLSWLHSP